MIKSIKIDASWKLFWLVSAVMASLMLWPFYAYEYPGLADYANHLSRLQILTGHVYQGWQKYYYIHYEVVPNLALDLIGYGFVQIGMTPEVALRVFAAVTALLLVAGTCSIAYVINKTPPWLALWSFLLVFNRYFVWGFLNYFFSIGVALLVFALWIYKRNNASLLEIKFKLWNVVFLNLLLIVVFISHLIGYGLLVGFIFIYEFCLCLEKHLSFKAILNHLGRVILALIPSVLFYIFICDHGYSGNGLGIQYYDVLKSKFAGLMSPFFSYNQPLTFIYIGGFVATAILIISQHLDSLKKIISKLYPNKLYLIPLAVFFMFLLLPSAVMGSHYLDKRLAVIVIFLLLALTVFKVDEKKLKLIIIMVMTLQIIKTVEVSHVWAKQSTSTIQISKALNNIKPQSTIEGFSFSDDDRMPVPPIQHVVSLAINQRAAFVPTLFALPINVESVGFNKPYSNVVYSTGVVKYIHSMDILQRVCNGFSEYILVTYMKHKPQVPSCLTTIVEGDSYILYRLKDKPIEIH